MPPRHLFHILKSGFEKEKLFLVTRRRFIVYFKTSVFLAQQIRLIFGGISIVLDSIQSGLVYKFIWSRRGSEVPRLLAGSCSWVTWR